MIKISLSLCNASSRKRSRKKAVTDLDLLSQYNLQVAEFFDSCVYCGLYSHPPQLTSVGGSSCGF